VGLGGCTGTPNSNKGERNAEYRQEAAVSEMLFTSALAIYDKVR